MSNLPEYAKGITPSLQTWTWLSIILTILFEDLLDINLEPKFTLNDGGESCCRLIWLTTKLRAKLLQQNETTNREEQILLRPWLSWNIRCRKRRFWIGTWLRQKERCGREDFITVDQHATSYETSSTAHKDEITSSFWFHNPLFRSYLIRGDYCNSCKISCMISSWTLHRSILSSQQFIIPHRVCPKDLC